MKTENLNTRLYSYIVQRKNVALALTIKSVGGPNIAVSLLLILLECCDCSAARQEQTYVAIATLVITFLVEKHLFLKHKNVNLKNLAEVKVVCTDFRRPKGINTTHLRQK